MSWSLRLSLSGATFGGVWGRHGDFSSLSPIFARAVPHPAAHHAVHISWHGGALSAVRRIDGVDEIHLGFAFTPAQAARSGENTVRYQRDRWLFRSIAAFSAILASHGADYTANTPVVQSRLQRRPTWATACRG